MKASLVFLSASISTVVSDLCKGLQRRSLFTFLMCNVQRWCWLCQGGNPHQWGCPHGQKNLPKGFHQVCQTPGLCRSLWSSLAGDHAGYARCNPPQPPVWQQAAGISLLPKFSSVWLTLPREICRLGLQLTAGVTFVPQLVLEDTLHLGPVYVHSAGATSSWFQLG